MCVSGGRNSPRSYWEKGARESPGHMGVLQGDRSEEEGYRQRGFKIEHMSEGEVGQA